MPQPHWGWGRSGIGGAGGPAPDPSQSFFVGDAAGRPKTGKGKSARKKDFGASDYKFACNVGSGMRFYTPEELFLKSTAPLHCDRTMASLRIL